MKTRVMIVIFLVAMLVTAIAQLNSANAAEPDKVSKVMIKRSHTGTTAFFKLPDWMASRQTRQSDKSGKLFRSGFIVNYFSMEFFKWENSSRHNGRTIDVILDYDDYTHIMRTYENKE